MTLHRLSFKSALLCFVLAAPAHAEVDNHDVVRTVRGDIVVNSFGNCVRTKWMSNTDACAPMQAKRRVPIAQEERTVYFDFNRSTLTPAARTRLDTLANTLRSDDQVREARIIGYADRIGTPTYNEKLSKRRAETVRNYLVSRQFVKARVAETRWFGESVPATNCPDTLTREELITCLQKDRRVEVEIDYLPDAAAAQQR